MDEQKMSKEQECLNKLNEVLQEYQMRLQPTFQLIPVKPVEEPKSEVEEPEAEDEVVASEEAPEVEDE